MDVLHEDLSHLTGEAICGAISDSSQPDQFKRIEPDLVSVEYLLDILRCIHEWITSRLESTTENSMAPESEADKESPVNDDEASGKEDQIDIDPNNNEVKEGRNEYGNLSAFSDYETKQLIDLIDDFENASVECKSEGFNETLRNEQNEEIR